MITTDRAPSTVLVALTSAYGTAEHAVGAAFTAVRGFAMLVASVKGALVMRLPHVQGPSPRGSLMV